MPSGPTVTRSISTGPGRHVATIAHPVAAAPGDSAQAAPALTSAAAASLRTSYTTSSCPAARRCSAIGRPMLPTPMNAIFTGGSSGSLAASQTIEAAGIVPQDLPLALVADLQLEEAVHRVGILRVAVRVIGRRHEIVIAERCHDVGHGLLVALERAEPLPAEVFGRQHREVAHVTVWLPPLVVLVHPGQPERQPSALALEEGEAKAREALHDAA